MHAPRNRFARYSALAVLAGAVLLGAVQNVVFTASLGNSAETRAVWIGLAVLAALVKLRVPLSPNWATNKVLLATFCVALLFDLLCAFGHGAITRGAKLDAYQRAIVERGELRNKVARLESELAALPVPSAPKESVAALTAAYRGEVAESRCTNRESRPWCVKRLAPYIERLEQARLVAATYRDADAARDAKAAELRDARAALEAHPTPEHPDPQAQAIVRALAGVWTISDRFAASLQTAVGMALIELAVIAGAVMLQMSGKPGTVRASAPAAPSAPRAPAPRPSGARTPESVIAALQALASGSTTAPGVTCSDGAIMCSQTALGLALGVSQPTVARYLRELEAAGRISVERAGHVTTIKLV